MQEQNVSEFDEQKRISITVQIAFFNELHHQYPAQFTLLLEHSRLVTYSPGEIIIEKSQIGREFYSLIRGSVDVFTDQKPSAYAVSQLSSGQLFGALSVLNKDRRSATLSASSPDGAQVLVTDLSLAGDLEDFSFVSLETKLGLYRHVVNNTRWKLQVYKNATSDPTLAQELSLFSLFEGEKGTKEELVFLSKQCEDLAALLDCWNDVAEPAISVPVVDSSTPFSKVFSMFKKSKSI